jgi:hypothetical protein
MESGGSADYFVVDRIGDQVGANQVQLSQAHFGVGEHISLGNSAGNCDRGMWWDRPSGGRGSGGDKQPGKQQQPRYQTTTGFHKTQLSTEGFRCSHGQFNSRLHPRGTRERKVTPLSRPRQRKNCAATGFLIQSLANEVIGAFSSAIGDEGRLFWANSTARFPLVIGHVRVHRPRADRPDQRSSR